jgi:hypothetical protein
LSKPLAPIDAKKSWFGGSGFRVEGGVQGSRFRVQDLGFRDEGLEFRVGGLGLEV